MIKNRDGCGEQNASNRFYSRVVAAMLGEGGIKLRHAPLWIILKPGDIRVTLEHGQEEGIVFLVGC